MALKVMFAANGACAERTERQVPGRGGGGGGVRGREGRGIYLLISSTLVTDTISRVGCAMRTSSLRQGRQQHGKSSKQHVPMMPACVLYTATMARTQSSRVASASACKAPLPWPVPPEFQIAKSKL